jgi:hypothetical protein
MMSHSARKLSGQFKQIPSPPIQRKNPFHQGLGSSIPRVDERLTEDQLVWAVGTASRYLPKATCLAQAMTLQLFLKQSGRQASLHIGVNGSEEGRLNAHAWVVSQGRVLFVGPNLSRYTHLLALE